MFESENEWQKTEQVPTSLPKNFPDVKTRNIICYNDFPTKIV